MTDHDRVWLAALAIVGMAWLIDNCHPLGRRDLA